MPERDTTNQQLQPLAAPSLVFWPLQGPPHRGVGIPTAVVHSPAQKGSQHRLPCRAAQLAAVGWGGAAAGIQGCSGGLMHLHCAVREQKERNVVVYMDLTMTKAAHSTELRCPCLACNSPLSARPSLKQPTRYGTCLLPAACDTSCSRTLGKAAFHTASAAAWLLMATLDSACATSTGPRRWGGRGPWVWAAPALPDASG